MGCAGLIADRWYAEARAADVTLGDDALPHVRDKDVRPHPLK